VGNFFPFQLLETEGEKPFGEAVSLYRPKQNMRAWKPIESAPLDREVELQVADQFGSYALTFPCRLTDGGWVNANSRGSLEVTPTHWRERKAG
jgi:hypothetical protein